MRGIINNIITFYGIQAKALSILVANTQKALEEVDGKRKADQQAEKVENFVKGLTMDVNDMLTRFCFHKERKQMTNAQTTALADFAAFVKILAKQVCSLLTRFEKSQTFGEKIDKEMKELETQVKVRLKEYDEVLRGTSDTLKDRLNKYVSNKVKSIKKFFRVKSVGLEKAEKAKLDSFPPHRLQDTLIDSIDSRDTQLEGFINVLNINTGGSSSKKSERQIHLEV